MKPFINLLTSLFRSKPAPKPKTTLVPMQDGKRHRVDSEGRIVGKTAQKRYNRAMKKLTSGNEADRG